MQKSAKRAFDDIWILEGTVLSFHHCRYTLDSSSYCLVARNTDGGALSPIGRYIVRCHSMSKTIKLLAQLTFLIPSLNVRSILRSNGPVGLSTNVTGKSTTRARFHTASSLL